MLPTAASGSVRRCAGRRPASTRASAYWPARSVSFGLASAIVTPIERVPGSAAGAMRASRPGHRRGHALDAHLAPACRAPGARTSCVPTRAGQFEPRQVDDGQQRLLHAELLAGHARGAWRRCREIGATSAGLAQADARGVERRLRRARHAPRALSSLRARGCPARSAR